MSRKKINFKNFQISNILLTIISIGFVSSFAITLLFLMYTFNKIAEKANGPVRDLILLESIASGPLKFAENYGSNVPTKILNFQMKAIYKEYPSYISARILGGQKFKYTYAHWETNLFKNISKECIDKISKIYTSKNALYPYKIVLVKDSCNSTFTWISLLKYGSYIFVILMSSIMVLVMLWIYRSLTFSSIAISNIPPSESYNLIEKIRWKEIRLLTRKSVQLKESTNENISKYICELKHDALKLVAKIDARYGSESDSSSQLKKLLKKEFDFREEKFKSNELKNCTYSEFKDLIESNYKHVKTNFDPNFSKNSFKYNHVELTRILINLSDNIDKNRKNGAIEIKINRYQIKIICVSNISYFHGICIFLYRKLDRIDVKNKNIQVISKFYGRDGSGLNIIKNISINNRVTFNIIQYYLKLIIHCGIKIHPEAKNLKLVKEEFGIVASKPEILEYIYQNNLDSHLVKGPTSLYRFKKIIADHQIKDFEKYSNLDIRIKETSDLKIFIKTIETWKNPT